MIVEKGRKEKEEKQKEKEKNKNKQKKSKNPNKGIKTQKNQQYCTKTQQRWRPKWLKNPTVMEAQRA